jgi:outer membrane protein
MKLKSIALIALFALTTIAVKAQKFGYVDTDYILSQMTEYRGAQKQLNEISEKWETELKIMKDEVDKLYKDYKAEEILLSATQKKEREDAIVAKEEAMKKYEAEKFGVNGELFKKRQELIKPIQDKVFSAVMKVAKDNALDFIFDKSANMNILYNNPKYDKSDDVLDILGVTPTEIKK